MRSQAKIFPLTLRAAGGNQIFCDAKVIWNADKKGRCIPPQFISHQTVKKSRLFGSALSLDAVRAVRAQVICAAYQLDRSARIGGQLFFDKGHVFDEFFAVAAADKGLETEEVVGAEMQF